MTPEEYAYLEATLTGRRGRDQSIEAKMSVRPEGTISRKAEERLQGRKSPEELEMEQREFNLKFFGKAHMEYYARPLTGLGPLHVPGDQVKGHSADQRPTPPRGLKLQFHSATEEPGCKMWLRAK